jgi:hypothetical protein
MANRAGFFAILHALPIDVLARRGTRRPSKLLDGRLFAHKTGDLEDIAFGGN